MKLRFEASAHVFSNKVGPSIAGTPPLVGARTRPHVRSRQVGGAALAALGLRGWPRAAPGSER
eukprot:scaffold571_cov364-Prasinococcus_capsulatus_cf.AAC.10